MFGTTFLLLLSEAMLLVWCVQSLLTFTKLRFLRIPRVKQIMANCLHLNLALPLGRLVSALSRKERAIKKKQTTVEFANLKRRRDTSRRTDDDGAGCEIRV